MARLPDFSLSELVFKLCVERTVTYPLIDWGRTQVEFAILFRVVKSVFLGERELPNYICTTSWYNGQGRGQRSKVTTGKSRPSISFSDETLLCFELLLKKPSCLCPLHLEVLLFSPAPAHLASLPGSVCIRDL